MKHPFMLERKRTGLVIIDMQEAFRPVIDQFDTTASRIGTMVQISNELNIPIIVTEQYPKGLGRTVKEITQHLQPGFEPIEKMVYSACGVQDFDTKLRELHIEQILICGIEAHICVSQTVHDLIQNQYQVHLLTDAISTRVPYNKDVAMKRLSQAGAVYSSIETATFELCGVTDPEFKTIQRLIKHIS